MTSRACNLKDAFSSSGNIATPNDQDFEKAANKAKQIFSVHSKSKDDNKDIWGDRMQAYTTQTMTTIRQDQIDSIEPHMSGESRALKQNFLDSLRGNPRK